MYFQNSIGKVYIKGNTLFYEDPIGSVEMKPNDPNALKQLYEFHVNQFKDMEKQHHQAKRLEKLLNEEDL